MSYLLFIISQKKRTYNAFSLIYEYKFYETRNNKLKGVDFMDKFEMPVGLGMALAQNPEAMQKFSSLTDKQKWEVVSGTHAVESRKEMQQYVQNIITAY